MANEAVQKGTTLLIGTGGFTYTGTCMEDVTVSSGGDAEENKGTEGETVNVTITNLKDEISFTATVEGTSITKPAFGSTVTVNGVAYRTTKADVKYSKKPKAAQFSFSGIKEASMSYS